MSAQEAEPILTDVIAENQQYSEIGDAANPQYANPAQDALNQQKQEVRLSITKYMNELTEIPEHKRDFFKDFAFDFADKIFGLGRIDKTDVQTYMIQYYKIEDMFTDTLIPQEYTKNVELILSKIALRFRWMIQRAVDGFWARLAYTEIRTITVGPEKQDKKRRFLQGAAG